MENKCSICGKEIPSDRLHISETCSPECGWAQDILDGEIKFPSERFLGFRLWDKNHPAAIRMDYITKIEDCPEGGSNISFKHPDHPTVTTWRVREDKSAIMARFPKDNIRRPVPKKP